MFQQNSATRAYIYFKHDDGWFTQVGHSGRIVPEVPSVRSRILNPNKIRLTSEDVTKESLKEEFAFYFDVNLDKENNSLLQVSRMFRPYLTARIDIILMSTEGDFQILSVSDDRAVMLKPKYLQSGGIGYQIESYLGKLTVLAKSTAKGKFVLVLRGIDIRDTEDKSKLIPVWIDYTSLVVNEKALLNKLTPVWHNKPYRYDMDVKACEEITVQVEWLPHWSRV